jgi:urease accessory protein
MKADTERMRATRPFVFTNLRTGEGVETIALFIEHVGGLA